MRAGAGAQDEGVRRCGLFAVAAGCEALRGPPGAGACGEGKRSQGQQVLEQEMHKLWPLLCRRLQMDSSQVFHMHTHTYSQVFHMLHLIRPLSGPPHTMPPHFTAANPEPQTLNGSRCCGYKRRRLSLAAWTPARPSSFNAQPTSSSKLLPTSCPPPPHPPSPPPPPPPRLLRAPQGHRMKDKTFPAPCHSPSTTRYALPLPNSVPLSLSLPLPRSSVYRSQHLTRWRVYVSCSRASLGGASSSAAMLKAGCLVSIYPPILGLPPSFRRKHCLWFFV
jgi:hypothetical protein